MQLKTIPNYNLDYIFQPNLFIGEDYVNRTDFVNFLI